MRIWGKVFGFFIGFVFGRIFGAIIGLWLGHLYDQRVSALSHVIGNGTNRQALFLNATFSVMGHVAKASGSVTENDIRIASVLMDQMRLTDAARREAQNAFNRGKANDFDLKDCLKTVRSLSMGRRELLQMFLEVQIQTALSDAKIDPQEHAILLMVSQELGYNRLQFDELLKRWQAEFNFHQKGNNQQTSIEDAYRLFGSTDADSDQQLKRRYRKLMNEHHPDKLVAKGLPAEMMELAKKKTQDIQAAYDRIKQERGMK